MAYDKKFKLAVVKFYNSGSVMEVVAETFDVGIGSVCAWVKEFKITGDIRDKKVQNREHLRKVTPEKIEALLLENPTADQVEMAKAFGCNNRAVSAALKKFGYSKKNSLQYTRNPTP
jgi:transposase